MSLFNRLIHHRLLHYTRSLSITPFIPTLSIQSNLLQSIMGSGNSTESHYDPSQGTLYDLSAKDIDGNVVKLSKYKGRCILYYKTTNVIYPAL